MGTINYGERTYDQATDAAPPTPIQGPPTPIQGPPEASVHPQLPAPEYFCESKDATSEALTLPSDPALCALEPFMSEFRSKLSTRPAWMLKARGGVGSATPATDWINN